MKGGFTQPAWMHATAPRARAADAGLRCAIAGRGMLRVAGPDATEFLHSQLSSNVRDLAGGQVRLTSYSDARGRLLAVMHLFADEDGFLLELPSERLDPIAAQLRRFVLRARVDIEDVSPAWAAFGVAGPPLESGRGVQLGTTPPGPGEWIALDGGARVAGIPGNEPRWLVFGPATGLEPVWQCSGGFETTSPQHWDLLDIRAGIPTIHGETAGRFVAQMVNLDRLDAVDFRKGCYPGQEVIARTRYLGRIKRRMFPLQLPPGARLPQPGDTVCAADTGDGIGEIVRAAPLPEGGVLALAVLQLAAIDAELTLEGTTVTRLDPPYPLDEAA